LPRIERTATLTWEGNLARGSGTVSGDSGAFTDLPFSLPSRIARENGKASPEELLAATHGGCITMSLAGELTQAGLPPTRLDVSCRVVMDEVEGQGHQVVGSHVEMTAAADGLDDAALQEAARKADEGCPYSQLLRRAGVDVQVTATLA
jgi:osmotically inducible protein OsmC